MGGRAGSKKRDIAQRASKANNISAHSSHVDRIGETDQSKGAVLLEQQASRLGGGGQTQNPTSARRLAVGWKSPLHRLQRSPSGLQSRGNHFCLGWRPTCIDGLLSWKCDALKLLCPSMKVDLLEMKRWVSSRFAKDARELRGQLKKPIWQCFEN